MCDSPGELGTFCKIYSHYTNLRLPVDFSSLKDACYQPCSECGLSAGYLKQAVFGESMSKSHTSELISRISLIYIHVSYVILPVHVYVCHIWTVCAWSNNTCAPRRFYNFRVVLLLVVNMDIPNTRSALKTSQDKEDRQLHRKEQEKARRVAETAVHRQERSTKRR